MGGNCGDLPWAPENTINRVTRACALLVARVTWRTAGSVQERGNGERLAFGDARIGIGVAALPPLPDSHAIAVLHSHPPFLVAAKAWRSGRRLAVRGISGGQRRCEAVVDGDRRSEICLCKILLG